MYSSPTVGGGHAGLEQQPNGASRNQALPIFRQLAFCPNVCCFLVTHGCNSSRHHSQVQGRKGEERRGEGCYRKSSWFFFVLFSFVFLSAKEKGTQRQTFVSEDSPTGRTGVFGGPATLAAREAGKGSPGQRLVGWLKVAQISCCLMGL